MTTRIVVCANDFPYGLLPAGTSMEDAHYTCKILQANDKTNLERWAPYAAQMAQFPNAYLPPPVVYYHCREVEEVPSLA